MDRHQSTDSSSVQYRPPPSGLVIGAVVDALGTRRGILATRQARRFLSGEPVTPEVRRRCIDALARQLIERKIVPKVVAGRASASIDHRVLSATIDWHADQWDRLGSLMYSQASRVNSPDEALRDYLRLVVVDLSVRSTALLWLMAKQPPDPSPPHWGVEAGIGKYLNSLRAKAGVTRDQLADDADVSRQAVDGWLDRGARPDEQRLDHIASSLSSGLQTDKEDLRETLTRSYFLQSLGDQLTKLTDRKTTTFMATSLVMMVEWQLGGFLTVVPSPNDATTWDNDQNGLEAEIQRAIRLAMGGCLTPESMPLLRAMADHQGDFEWQLALKAAGFDWSLYLQLQQLRQGIATLAGDDPPDTQISVEVRKAEVEQMVGAIDALFRGDLLESIASQFKLMEIWKAALDASPDDPWLHFSIGSFVGNHLNPDEGIRECWIAVKLEPDWELPQVEIGIIYLKASRHEEGRAHLERIAEQRTDHSWHLLYNLAESRRRCGDIIAALQAYEDGIAVNPNHALMRDRAAHCAFLTDDSVKGRRLAKSAHVLGSNETYKDWKAGRYRKKR